MKRNSKTLPMVSFLTLDFEAGRPLCCAVDDGDNSETGSRWIGC